VWKNDPKRYGINVVKLAAGHVNMAKARINYLEEKVLPRLLFLHEARADRFSMIALQLTARGPRD